MNNPGVQNCDTLIVVVLLVGGSLWLIGGMLVSLFIGAMVKRRDKS